MNVQIVLFDGFDLLDAIAPFEVFTAAAMYSHEDITVKLVSAEGKRLVRSGVNDVPLQAVDKLNIHDRGIIVVPGASGSINHYGPDSIPVKLKEASETVLGSMLKEAMDNTEILLSTVCGGSLILAMAGLLTDRHAVTHHLGMELLNATNAIAVNARVVDDGDLVTSGGVTSGLDLALYLVERGWGPRIAHAVEQLFEYERRGTVWKNDGNAPQEVHDESVKEAASSHSLTATSDGIEFVGKWDATINTPIGKLAVLFDIKNNDGKLTGTGKQGEDIVPLDDVTIEGNSLKWSMKVSKPMRLTLKFTVSVDGDIISGEAKAGMLPSSKLIGARIS
ncbi:DJ-1/PfpI family protein [Robertmurraya sp. FSL W8-0741]|uniref:DJ-1/PfpI family protein n=1 Tax=Robertmurraya sp. FSL W8-0741 TaxID=2954629 RepID=UPI0030FCA372